MKLGNIVSSLCNEKQNFSTLVEVMKVTNGRIKNNTVTTKLWNGEGEVKAE